MHPRIGALLIGAALTALLAPGGSLPAAEKPGKTGAVQGKVTYKGLPVTGGTVAFHPAKGKPVVAKIQADGGYSAKDVPVGEVVVAVETESVKKAGGGAKYVKIPAKYAGPKTSGITVTIKEGKQTYDIDLR
jgi:hypothetical protein